MARVSLAFPRSRYYFEGKPPVDLGGFLTMRDFNAMRFGTKEEGTPVKESEEKAYIEGQKEFARRTLTFAISLLRENGEETDGARALKTLSEVKAALRRVCQENGIDLPEDPHPVDVVRLVGRIFAERATK